MGWNKLWSRTVPLLLITLLGAPCNSSEETFPWGGQPEGPSGNAVTPPLRKPQVAMDGYGSGMVAWNDGQELWVKRYDSDSGWEERVRIAERDHYPDAPDVATVDGNAVVIWKEATQSIYGLGHIAGAGWKEVPDLVARNLDGLKDPEVVVNTAGGATTALVVWRGRLEPPLAPVMAAFGRRYLLSLGEWQPTARLDTDNASPAEQIWSVTAAMNHRGTGRAIWSQAGDSIHAGWGGTAVRISDEETSASQPCLAYDREGNALAVWIEYGSVYACRFDEATAGWNEPILIEYFDYAVNAASAPHLAMNGDGAAFVVWWGTSGGIYVNRSVGGSFLGAHRIDIAPGGEQLGRLEYESLPNVVVDEEGYARVIWYNGVNVCTVHYDAKEGIWGPAERIGSYGYPDIDADPTGRVIAVWWDDGLETRVWDAPNPPAVWTMVFAGQSGAYQNVFLGEADSDGFLALPERVTTGATEDWMPTLSPDGSRICFVRDDEIWIVDANGDNETSLTDSPTYKGDPTFTPNGESLVYVDENAIVMLDLLPGGGTTTLTDTAANSAPSVSPDGEWLAFVSSRELPGGVAAPGNIWIMKMDRTGDPTPVTTSSFATAEFAYANPAWSPDGKKIVCQCSDGNLIHDLHVLDVFGTSQPVKLASEDGPENGEPVFTPDGQSVVYAARYYWHDMGTYVRELWKVPADGSGSAERFGAIGATSHHPSFAGKP